MEVCRDLRAKKIETPILMLTARDTIKDKIEGLNIGADDYLTKPFEFAELLARARALLRRRNSSLIRPKVEIVDLVIDTNSQRVWRHEKEIELTAKEYCLLEFMAREKRQNSRTR